MALQDLFICRWAQRLRTQLDDFFGYSGLYPSNQDLLAARRQWFKVSEMHCSHLSGHILTQVFIILKSQVVQLS